jgi:precorrin-2 dehydrogenase / sirohydrochlorin ferrochelatase
MPFAYPVMLELAGRRCVVIGDDAVRDRKVEALLAAGADDVLVVACGPVTRLDQLDGIAGLTVARRPWRRAATPESAMRSPERPAPGARS